MEGELQRRIWIGVILASLLIIIELNSSLAWILFVLLETVALYFVLIHGRTGRKSVGWIKIGLLLVCLEFGSFVSSVQDPTKWGSQYANGVNPNLLITPEDPYVIELETRFFSWIETTPTINETIFPTDAMPHFVYYKNDGARTYADYTALAYRFNKLNWTALDEIQRSMIVDFYIQKYIVNWTSDSTVYGVSDYKATPHEILQMNVDNGWTAPATDDCDGIAAVTVSLLRRMDIEAYFGKGIGHLFTVVIPTNATKIKYDRLDSPVLLNYWETVHLWCYYDNQMWQWGQTPLKTIEDLTLMGSTDDYEPIIAFVKSYRVISYFLTFLASILIVLIIGYPRKYAHPGEDELRNLRKVRAEQKFPKIMAGKNPLKHIINFFVIRTGNPFRKTYAREWINIGIIWALIIVVLEIMLANFAGLTQYTTIYLYLIGGIFASLLERDVFIRIIERIRKPAPSLV